MPYDANPTPEVIARSRMFQLRDFLAKLPREKFDMRSLGDPERVDLKTRDCNTPACIAGWGAAMFAKRRYQNPDAVARRALGLSHREASALFQLNRHIGDIPRYTAAQAVRVIDHYLETGKIDWSIADHAAAGRLVNNDHPPDQRKERDVSKSEWQPMCCSSEYDFRALRSWFPVLVPKDWGDPLKADVLTNVETDATTKIRALFRRPDGELREAIRSNGRRFSITIRLPSRAILKDWKP